MPLGGFFQKSATEQSDRQDSAGRGRFKITTQDHAILRKYNISHSDEISGRTPRGRM
jgi:hypothetical protein